MFIFNSKLKFFASSILITLSYLSSNCLANTFELFDDHDKLKNTLILETGDAEEFVKYIGTGFDSKQVKRIRFNNKCFDSDVVYILPNKTASPLISDERKKLFIALFNKSIFNIEVKVIPVSEASCSVFESANLPQVDKETGDFLCKLFDDYKGKMPEWDIINICRKSMPMEACLKCIVRKK